MARKTTYTAGRRDKLKMFQKGLALCGVLTFCILVPYLITFRPTFQRVPRLEQDYLYDVNLQNLDSEQDRKDIFDGDKLASSSTTGDNLYESDKFQLYLDHCKIPKVPLMLEANKQREWKIKLPKCPKGISSIDKQGNLIISNFENFNCCYKVIKRERSGEKDDYEISTDCLPLKSNVTKIRDEFIKLNCKEIISSKKSERIEYHATIQLNEKIQNKIKYWDFNFPNEHDRPPGVVMLAIDSSSRTNFYRTLPKTVKLLEKLDFIDFKGHHIQGEPTFPNSIPILFGKSAEQFWKDNKPNWTAPWDKYPFIWKEFDNLNYITMFTEDEQNVGTFAWGGQTGFVSKPPTDVYLRPLLLDFEATNPKSLSMTPCLGNKALPVFLLDHLTSLLNKVRGIPIFTLNWSTWPQHDLMENRPVLDDPVSNFLDKLDQHVFERYFIIIFSDHGQWNAPYSKTPPGLLERRLPFLFIRYPELLKTKNQDQFYNLQNNAQRLTTHFDTHQTLLNIVEMAYHSVEKRNQDKESTNSSLTLEDFISRKSKKGISLFDKISKDRNCRDANIPPFACACGLSYSPDEHQNYQMKSKSNLIVDLELPPVGSIGNQPLGT